jgi:2-hydroxy-6-oxo-6-(2'-aminophenyl)hexa-2,4-dienoate hydrolase
MTATTEFESRFVETDGYRTHYLEAGQGPTLILMHGGGAGADAYGNWRECIPILARKFRVIAPDMVGFGCSDKPSPETFTYDQPGRNRQLVALLEALNIDKAFLVGNSMGGATCIGATLHCPQRVERLVLMGSAGLPIPERPSPQLLHNLNYDFTIEGMRRVIAGLTSPRYQPPEDLVQYRYKLTLEPGAREALAAVNAATRKGTLNYPEDELRKIEQPVLIVNGKEDGVSTLARAYRFLELFENSWGYIVPHCGHWAMIERTADFCAAVERFLTQPVN